jgi:F420-dependent oxidoreductase-like protein
VDLGLFIAPQQGASYEDQLVVARRAERHGFSAVVRSDHYLAFGGRVGLPGPTDSWVTLAGLARETDRVRIGTMVSSATFRQPGPLAVAVAQVDAMSGGRVLFGIGTGWSAEEHRAYGIPFPRLAERFERLEEQLAIIRGLWTTPVGSTFSFAGRYHRLEASPALPKPVQRPHPPIVVGGQGQRRTPALAAAFADEYNFPPPLEGPRAVADGFARARRACEAAGRDPASLSLSVTLTVVCGSDRKELQRRRGALPEGLVDVSGSPAEVAEQLATYAAVGADRAYLRLDDLKDLAHVDLLGAEVLRDHLARGAAGPEVVAGVPDVVS